MFSIYVHKEKKIQDYDAEFKKYSGQTIDPVPRVAEMVEKAANMTDKEFHYKFADLFASLRDLHTNYEMVGYMKNLFNHLFSLVPMLVMDLFKLLISQ